MASNPQLKMTPDGDDEDVEALYLAALKTLKAKDAAALQHKQKVNKPYAKGPSLRTSHYGLMNTRSNNCFQRHCGNSNLIAIVPINDVSSPLPVSKLILPQDRYASNINIREPPPKIMEENVKVTDKFSRYDQSHSSSSSECASESDSASDHEDPDEDADVLVMDSNDLENSLDKLISQLDDHINDVDESPTSFTGVVERLKKSSPAPIVPTHTTRSPHVTRSPRSPNHVSRSSRSPLGRSRSPLRRSRSPYQQRVGKSPPRRYSRSPVRSRRPVSPLPRYRSPPITRRNPSPPVRRVSPPRWNPSPPRRTLQRIPWSPHRQGTNRPRRSPSPRGFNRSPRGLIRANDSPRLARRSPSPRPVTRRSPSPRANLRRSPSPGGNVRRSVSPRMIMKRKSMSPRSFSRRSPSPRGASPRLLNRRKVVNSPRPSKRSFSPGPVKRRSPLSPRSQPVRTNSPRPLLRASSPRPLINRATSPRPLLSRATSPRPLLSRVISPPSMSLIMHHPGSPNNEPVARQPSLSLSPPPVHASVKSPLRISTGGGSKPKKLKKTHHKSRKRSKSKDSVFEARRKKFGGNVPIIVERKKMSLSTATGVEETKSTGVLPLLTQQEVSDLREKVREKASKKSDDSDLRTELSRRRAERALVAPGSRIVQSAILELLNKKPTEKIKTDSSDKSKSAPNGGGEYNESRRVMVLNRQPNASEGNSTSTVYLQRRNLQLRLGKSSSLHSVGGGHRTLKLKRNVSSTANQV